MKRYIILAVTMGVLFAPGLSAMLLDSVPYTDAAFIAGLVMCGLLKLALIAIILQKAYKLCIPIRK